jgi:uroporphyrinogen-III synthase
MPSRSNLNGLGVLVTRPAHQAGPLCDRITAAGGRSVRFPLLTIHDTGTAPQVCEHLQQLDTYAVVIFISPNAVHFGLPAIERHGGLPAGLQLAAVGRGTARELERAAGRAPDLVPHTRFDSEGLLALPALQDVAGKRILIVRGNGGRELLADTLRQRGAEVDYAEVYRREPASLKVAEPDWLNNTDIITVTSSEALENLVEQTAMAQRDTLFGKPLVVVSERTATKAEKLGFRLPAKIATQASDEAIMDAVTAWAAEAFKVE